MASYRAWGTHTPVAVFYEKCIPQVHTPSLNLSNEQNEAHEQLENSSQKGHHRSDIDIGGSFANNEHPGDLFPTEKQLSNLLRERVTGLGYQPQLTGVN